MNELAAKTNISFKAIVEAYLHKNPTYIHLIPLLKVGQALDAMRAAGQMGPGNEADAAVGQQDLARMIKATKSILSTPHVVWDSNAEWIGVLAYVAACFGDGTVNGHLDALAVTHANTLCEIWSKLKRHNPEYKVVCDAM